MMFNKDEVEMIVRQVDTPIQIHYVGRALRIDGEVSNDKAVETIKSMPSNYPYYFHARHFKSHVHAWVTQYDNSPKNRVELCDLRW